jgi:hypothetical protein
VKVTAAAARLKRKRGDERVTFEHVADHLVDFAERSPEHDGVMADLADFLAEVEDVKHDHSQIEDHTVIAQEE